MKAQKKPVILKKESLEEDREAEPLAPALQRASERLNVINEKLSAFLNSAHGTGTDEASSGPGQIAFSQSHYVLHRQIGEIDDKIDAIAGMVFGN